MDKNYDDIINLPHYEPKFHPRMSRYKRACQFAPFAALVGYEEHIKETSRLTNVKKRLTNDDKMIINEKLIRLKDVIKSKPLVSIMYFVKDLKKQGGEYKHHIGNLKKIDEYNKTITFEDKFLVSMNDILDITSEIFEYEIIE